jgi:hypothetical protein
MLRRRNIIFTIRTGLFIVSLLSAAMSFAGEYAADFLRIGVGARPLAMGSAFVAMPNDPASYYWNPAGLAQRCNVSLQFDHVPMFGGLAQFNAANVTLSFKKSMAIGISWIRLGVDEIPRYSDLQGTRFDRLTDRQYRSTGEANGYFADTEDAILFSIGRTEYLNIYFGSGFSEYVIPIEFSMGVTGKYIQQKLDAFSGTGQGIDAGSMVRLVSLDESAGEPNSWLGLGVSARDLSHTSIVWNTKSNHKDQVRTGLQTGLAASKYIPGVRTRFTVSFDQEFGFYKDSHVGAEACFFNILSLRGGYYQEKFSAGAGISFFRFRADYAFINHDLENTHRISGSFRF